MASYPLSPPNRPKHRRKQPVLPKPSKIKNTPTKQPTSQSIRIQLGGFKHTNCIHKAFKISTDTDKKLCQSPPTSTNKEEHCEGSTMKRILLGRSGTGDSGTLTHVEATCTGKDLYPVSHSLFVCFSLSPIQCTILMLCAVFCSWHVSPSSVEKALGQVDGSRR